MHSIQIAGVWYSNVATIKPSIEREYNYDIVTLDGTRHQDTKFEKKNYTITFFNLIDGVYLQLKNFIEENKDVAIRCKIPNGTSQGDFDEFFIEETNGEIMKGFLQGGNITDFHRYYVTGYTIVLKRV